MVIRGCEGRITGYHGNTETCRGSNDRLDSPCFFLNMHTLDTRTGKKKWAWQHGVDFMEGGGGRILFFQHIIDANLHKLSKKLPSVASHLHCNDLYLTSHIAMA